MLEFLENIEAMVPHLDFPRSWRHVLRGLGGNLFRKKRKYIGTRYIILSMTGSNSLPNNIKQIVNIHRRSYMKHNVYNDIYSGNSNVFKESCGIPKGKIPYFNRNHILKNKPL